MNKERRKMLKDVVVSLDNVRSTFESVKDEIDLIYDDVSYVINDEQYSFDSLPENLQGSERGEKMEEYISILEDVSYNLDIIKGDIEELLNRTDETIKDTNTVIGK